MALAPTGGRPERRSKLTARPGWSRRLKKVNQEKQDPYFLTAGSVQGPAARRQRYVRRGPAIISRLSNGHSRAFRARAVVGAEFSSPMGGLSPSVGFTSLARGAPPRLTSMSGAPQAVAPARPSR